MRAPGVARRGLAHAAPPRLLYTTAFGSRRDCFIDAWHAWGTICLAECSMQCSRNVRVRPRTAEIRSFAAESQTMRRPRHSSYAYIGVSYTRAWRLLPAVSTRMTTSTNRCTKCVVGCVSADARRSVELGRRSGVRAAVPCAGGRPRTVPRKSHAMSQSPRKSPRPRRTGRGDRTRTGCARRLAAADLHPLSRVVSRRRDGPADATRRAP